MCHNIDDSVQVHHHLYIKNRHPCEYDDKLLTTLCDKCHKGISKHGFTVLGKQPFNAAIEKILINNDITFFDFCYLFEYILVDPEIFIAVHEMSKKLLDKKIKKS